MWRRRVVPALFGLAIVAALALLRLADPYPVQVARGVAFDVFQQWAPRPASDAPVRVVDIDEASLAQIGQWPWPRNVLAKLTSRLGEMGAAAIGFDMLFPEVDRLSPAQIARSVPALAAAAATLPDFDQQFADALKSTPSALGFAISPSSQALPGDAKAGFAISGTDPTPSIPLMRGAVLPLPLLGNAAPGLGGLSLDASDAVTVVRQLPLVWSNGKDFFPTLSLETLRLALGLKTIVVLGDDRGQGFVQSVRLGDLSIPTTATGDLTLYFSRPDAAVYLSAKDVLGPDYLHYADRVKGEIVLVGTSASGLLDLHATPLGDNVPGVSIHAQAIAQILSGAFPTRADWVSGLELLSFIVIGTLIVFGILMSGPLIGLMIGATLLAGMAGFSWVMFTQIKVLVDPSFPLFGAFITYAAMVFFRFLITDADRRQIRRAFGHYVDPLLLDEIERKGDDLKLGGEMRDVTVMFADMRNFTSISERLVPAELLAVLNTLFGALGAEITAEFGTIDKFVGDSIMAFWNAPVDVANHGLRAANAALGMQQRLAKLNAENAFDLGEEKLAIGIGISTGEALVGNMGLETRFDYSCLGDTVNVASRVEGACKAVGYDIVVSETTRTAAALLAFLSAGAVVLKGKSARVPIHILVGDKVMAASPGFAALLAAHEQAVGALQRGEDASSLIESCKTLAAPMEARLERFYDMLAARREDFG